MSTMQNDLSLADHLTAVADFGPATRRAAISRLAPQEIVEGCKLLKSKRTGALGNLATELRAKRDEQREAPMPRPAVDTANAPVSVIIAAAEEADATAPSLAAGVQAAVAARAVERVAEASAAKTAAADKKAAAQHVRDARRDRDAEICRVVSEGASLRAAADQFGITETSTIRRIIRVGGVAAPVTSRTPVGPAEGTDEAAALVSQVIALETVTGLTIAQIVRAMARLRP